MEQSLYLAVDGGATHCRARIADSEGTCLGSGEGGPANTRLGIDRVFREILTATSQALAAASLDSSRVGDLHAGLGLAGLTLEADRRAVMNHPHPFLSLTAETDAYTACLGAHLGQDGGIVTLGTGSNACAIVDGTIIDLGGWGFRLGDQGSAAQVGLAALRRTLLACEGIAEASALTRALLERFSSSPEQAVLWAQDAGPADFGALAHQVTEHAARGDAVAVALMREAAADAALLIAALRKRNVERIALVGGFARHIRPWLTDEHCKDLVEARGDGLDGALILARRAVERMHAVSDAG